MPTEAPSIYQRPSEHGAPIEEQANALARRVLHEWALSGSTENKALVDDMQRAFLEEANHSLRQVLFQLGARLELALAKSRKSGEQGGLDERTAGSLMDALTRAAKIVDVYLDRSRAAQFALTLHPEPFRLDDDLQDMLKWNGFLDEPGQVDLETAPAPVVADRERLRDVLGHIVARFWFSRTPGQRLIVRVRPDEHGGAHGFIGVSESHVYPEDLIEEINDPLSLEAIEIDIPYTRTVLERHGGTLYVASYEDDTIGFGFKLPSVLPEEPPQEKQHDR